MDNKNVETSTSLQSLQFIYVSVEIVHHLILKVKFTQSTVVGSRIDGGEYTRSLFRYHSLFGGSLPSLVATTTVLSLRCLSVETNVL